MRIRKLGNTGGIMVGTLRYMVLVGVLPWLAAFGCSAQAAEPEAGAARVAVVLRSAASDGSADSLRLLHALERNGYRGVATHEGDMAMIPVEAIAVRGFVNSLRGCSNGAEVLLVYTGPLCLKEDGAAWLGRDDRHDMALATLAEQLGRLDADKFTIALLLDVESDSSAAQIEQAIVRFLPSINANLNVTVGRRKPSDSQSLSPLVELFCKALTYEREVDANQDGIVSPAEFQAFGEKKACGTVEFASVASPKAEKTMRLVRLRPASGLDDVLEIFGDELVDVVRDCGASVVALSCLEANGGAANASSRYSGPLTPYVLQRVRRHVSQALGQEVQVVLGGGNEQAAKQTTACVEGNVQVDLDSGNETSARLTLGGRINVYREGKQIQSLRMHDAAAPLKVDEAGMSGQVNMSPKAAMAAMGIQWSIDDLDAPPARAPHPMIASGFPLRVYLESPKGEPFEHRFSKDGRRMHVAAKKGDEYVIAVENNTAHDLFLRLLVDGRNTLPDRLEDRAALEPAQYVSLTRARCWLCEAGKKYRIAGFFTQVVANPSRNEGTAQWRAFSVADVNDAPPFGEQREQLGIITAAFYEAVAKDKSSMASQPQFATRLGTAGEGDVGIYTGDLGPGALIGDAPIAIHYGFGSDGDD